MGDSVSGKSFSAGADKEGELLKSSKGKKLRVQRQSFEQGNILVSMNLNFYWLDSGYIHFPSNPNLIVSTLSISVLFSYRSEITGSQRNL